MTQTSAALDCFTKLNAHQNNPDILRLSQDDEFYRFSDGCQHCFEFFYVFTLFLYKLDIFYSFLGFFGFILFNLSIALRFC